jgi:hemolysin activation/secretion protein
MQSGSTMEQVSLELVFTEEFTQKGFLFKIFYDGGRAYSRSTQPAEMLQGAGFGFGTSKKDGLGIGFNVGRTLDGKGPVESAVRLNFNF